MSCPDWQAIAAARAADPLVDPPGFDAARSHLASCESCRRVATAADPLLLFASLGRPEREGARPAFPIDPAMESAVLAMVRASRVGAGETSGSGRAKRAVRLSGLAAGLLFASLLVLSGTPVRSPGNGWVGGLSGGPLGAPAPSGTAEGELTADLRSLDEPELLALERLLEAAESGPLPVVEEIDRPDARVYDLSQADLAVVMIVDAGLDV